MNKIVLCESVLQRLLGLAMGNSYRAEVYLTTWAIQKAAKSVVFEGKKNSS